jgi:hypothetical protein
MGRAELAADVRRLRETHGLRFDQIGERLGISRTYANALFLDPTGDTDRARKDAYGGVCEDCGGPTSGSEGPSKVAQFCLHCAPNRQNRKWTRETVIAAIQHWAAEHGKPPRASDWNNARRNNGNYEYPPATSVYKSDRSRAPFETWADAIEAAGFPRPLRGQHERKAAHMTSTRFTRTYIVFSVNGDGLSIIGETEAATNQEAIEALAGDAGKYASVAKATLQTYTLAPKLVASREP